MGEFMPSDVLGGKRSIKLSGVVGGFTVSKPCGDLLVYDCLQRVFLTDVQAPKVDDPDA